MRSRFCSSVGIAISAVLVVIAGTVSASDQESIQSGDTAKAVREVTGEIRSLRAAIERTADSQLQGQILGLYLSLQQNRVSQATARLDTVRRELEAVSGRTRELTQVATSMDTSLGQETDPVKRRQLEVEQREVKREWEKFAAQEQQVRTREAEAYQGAQTEEARWTELISRLEQLLKK